MHTRPVKKPMFTRREVAKLTGLTSGQVRHLYETGMIRFEKLDPENISSPIIFHWNTLLECRVIANLRRLGISLQKLRRAKNYLLDLDPKANLSDHTFALLGNELLIVKSSEVEKKLLVQVTGRNVGQFILFPVSDLQHELDEQAEIIKIADWQKRKNIRIVQVA